MLIVPDPETWTVGVKPDLSGDVVVEQFSDMRTGITYVIARTPAGAEEIATLLHTAVVSPRVGAISDQMRASQRDRQQ